MAERFDRYYEYFSGRSRATRGGRFRRLNLGIVRIDLSGGGSVLRVNIGRSRAQAIEVVGGVVPVSYTHLTLPTIYSV